MPVKFTIVLAISLLLFCAPAFAEHAQPMGNSEFSTRSASGLDYQLQIASNPIQTMQAQPATIRISDPDGAPVSGAEVFCALTMPSMAMAKNQPPVKETQQAGHYESIFLFTMGGDWAVNCSITLPDSNSEQIVFAIDDVPHGKMAKDKHEVNKMLGEKKHGGHDMGH